MRTLCHRLSVLIVVAILVPLAPVQASAASSTPANPGGLPQTLTQVEQQLTNLNDHVERAGAALDTLNRRLAADVSREGALRRQLQAIARLQYERPALSLTLILNARSLSELISDLSQARLVADKQQAVLNQVTRLHQLDQQARDQAAAALSSIQSARDAASRMVQTLTGAGQQMALAVSGVGTAAGPWPNHFAFGFCTYYVATRRFVPWFGNANQWIAGARAYGFAEGSTPRVGAIMVTAEGPIGHVAYVEAVHPDGSWTVAEMNFAAWNVVDRRTIHPGQIPLISPGFVY